ncbi:LapA family protein [Paenibacillus spongiae]|uniref:Lipopolysaccharide assembly protein LapA domain-containing protein n=1 Tax=Paenibacillus spongiae TaxID=2909671 RepID=A0ABY5S295_9BACL|nr:lipopolysaccharide assembly protein LapA domain-containing protein [Paenibacillus spongiae]UVI27784.1 lipopolysaccharide assembly protein LapA domain-containing protein [Paenibacillus spongiae]
MKAQWSIIAALLFALITAVFAVINVDAVQVNFLFTKTESPLILVILVSTLLGGLTVGLFGIVRQYKLQRRIRELDQKLAALGLKEQEGSDVLVKIAADKPSQGDEGKPARLPKER